MANNLRFGEHIKIFGPKGKADEVLAEIYSLFGADNKENEARQKIQNMIDDKKIPSGISVLYDGNTVWGHQSIINEWKRMIRADSLSTMSKNFYNFCHLAANDIAHYDRNGYISYYNDSPKELFNFFKHQTSRFYDVDRVLHDLIAAGSRKYA